MPPVAFYKPVGVLNQHPGYANVVAADEEVGRIVGLMEDSPIKGSYAVIITYDEFGGFFDHVPPPQPSTAGGRADFFGPGSRVATIVVSPFARKGVIEHTQYDTTSILRLMGNGIVSPRCRAHVTAPWKAWPRSLISGSEILGRIGDPSTVRGGRFLALPWSTPCVGSSREHRKFAKGR